MSRDISVRTHTSMISLRSAGLLACLACLACASLAPAANAATFTNTTPIAIPAIGNATPYPSPITVSGMTGQVTDVNVTLHNFSHTDPEDVAVVLVPPPSTTNPPTGSNILLMDGPGGETQVSGVNITFDDSATALMPQFTAFTSGSYRPTAYFTGDAFPAPGPQLTYCNPGPAGGGLCTLGSALNGTLPNGTWNLYVIDLDNPDAGSIAGGWSLDITSGVVPQRTLTASTAGTGVGTVTASGTVPGTGINCGADCTEEYNNGALVQVTATPAAGSSFAGWTGCDNPSANTCTMNMTANKAITATFTPSPPTRPTLTVSIDGTGDGAVTGTGISCGSDCNEAYDDGTPVVLTAAPAAGSSFAGWTGCDNPSANTCTMNMTGAKTVAARFAVNPPPRRQAPAGTNPNLTPAFDTTNPLLTALSVSPASFRGATKISYRLSETAAVRFRVQRALRGRRVGGRCRKRTRSNRRARKCTRYSTLRGSVTHRGKAGANSLDFSGRLRGRKLRPGRYRLRAVATDAVGNQSAAKRVRFRIRR